MLVAVIREPFTFNGVRFTRGQAVSDAATIHELKHSPHAHHFLMAHHPDPKPAEPVAEEAPAGHADSSHAA